MPDTHIFVTTEIVTALEAKINHENVEYSPAERAFVHHVTRSGKSLRRLALHTWPPEGLTVLSIRAVANTGCFTRLVALDLGWEEPLSLEVFFTILSLTPALTDLSFGNITSIPEALNATNDISGAASDDIDVDHDNDVNDGDDVGDFEDPTPTLPYPLPVCRLRRLDICDDWGFDFIAYAHLLHSSHESLREVSLTWIFNEEVGHVVCSVLRQCKKMRSLTLVGNYFSIESVVRACYPRITSLAVEDVPDTDMLARSCPALRELRMFDCRTTPPDEFFEEREEGLVALLEEVPKIKRIALLMNEPMPRSPELDSYVRLKDACRRRRVHLSVQKPYEGQPHIT